MTHDPLCPRRLCFCILIARVREDERRQYSNYSNARNTGRRDGYTAGLQDAINAVNKFINNPEDDWDKAIDNLFIQRITEAIQSLKGDR